jgi:hypothetical protein
MMGGNRPPDKSQAADVGAWSARKRNMSILHRTEVEGVPRGFTELRFTTDDVTLNYLRAGNKFLSEYDTDFSRATIEGDLSKGFDPEATLK